MDITREGISVIVSRGENDKTLHVGDYSLDRRRVRVLWFHIYSSRAACRAFVPASVKSVQGLRALVHINQRGESSLAFHAPLLLVKELAIHSFSRPSHRAPACSRSFLFHYLSTANYARFVLPISIKPFFTRPLSPLQSRFTSTSVSLAFRATLVECRIIF